MKGRARRRSIFAAFAVAGLTAIAVLAAGATQSASGGAAEPAAKLGKDCKLDNGVKHVIYLIFDNVHFLRDNPNVPSDVEQMPHLLNFVRNNGTLMTNDHTVLISHTANGILTNLTGMYSDRHGQAVANSYRYFRSDGLTNSSSSFKYWTDATDGGNAATDPPTASADSNFNMVTGDSGSPHNTPAPWAPYTRAGCDFGATALANVVLENNSAVVFAAGPTTLAAAATTGATNIKVASVGGFKAGMSITVDAGANAESATIAPLGVGTAGPTGTGITLTAPLTKDHANGVTVYGPTATDAAGDMTKVFGEGSPEWTEGQDAQKANPGTAARNFAQTDFVGLAIHCAKGSKSICAGNSHARTDQLPDEPGGYTGFQGLFGAKYVNPAICTVSTSNCTNATVNGQTALKKLDGTQITDQFDQPGFPGFDGLFASTTLSYVAQMQEAGIPITYGYISDAHDEHGKAGEIHTTDGPGEKPYVDQLKAYDAAFAKFFDRLADDGITKKNTLFVVTTEEDDHFSGAIPTPSGCDGVTSPCNYSLKGEINVNLTGLLATQQGITTPFTVHADMAPTIYLNGNPARTAPVTRAFGRAVGNLTATNSYTGVNENITAALADPVEMKTLHMVTADPQRTPTLTMFALPDYFLFAGAANCNQPCITVPTTPPTNTFAWNHGGIQPEIATNWLGIVGPGVREQANDDTTWADHTDVRPTMLSLLGLEDSYVHDGRVLTNALENHAQPHALREHRRSIRQLGDTYKQLNAPFGAFAVSTLQASTKAIRSGNTGDDSRYTSIEDQIASLTSARDTLATQIRNALDAAAFGGPAINEHQARDWIAQAQALINRSAALAAMT